MNPAKITEDRVYRGALARLTAQLHGYPDWACLTQWHECVASQSIVAKHDAKGWVVVQADGIPND